MTSENRWSLLRSWSIAFLTAVLLVVVYWMQLGFHAAVALWAAVQIVLPAAFLFLLGFLIDRRLRFTDRIVTRHGNKLVGVVVYASLAIAVALIRSAIGYFSILNTLIYFFQGFLPAFLIILWWVVGEIVGRLRSDKG